MNDTLKHIEQRFSCRDFTDQPPTNEQLKAIAQAAIQSPSGMNRQLWQVIVVTNQGLILEMEQEAASVLSKMDPSLYQHVMAQSGGALFYHAPCMILFAIKTAQPPGAELIDLGILAQNTVLAATSLGLATLHCGFAGLAFVGEKAIGFKQKLKFANGYECGMAVLLGHAKTIRSPHVPDPTKVTYIR